jgi:hypothetical protein
MKLGAEKNKLILLGVFGAIACVTVYTQFFSGPDLPRTRRPAAERASAKVPRKTTRRQRRTVRPARGQPFRPSFGAGDDSGEALDPMTVDPTLQTELLAMVRGVEFGGVERNIFRFGQRKPKVLAGPTAEEAAEAARRAQAATAAAVAAPTPPTPAPQVKTSKGPPIKWKYYGFANSAKDARKRAFLLGEESEVFVATEGDIFKKRFRIVRIGVNSIVIEDMQFKDEQTLPLQES